MPITFTHPNPKRIQRRRLHLWRLALLLSFTASLLLGTAGAIMGQEQHALVAKVDADINSVTQRYIERILHKGVEEGAEIVIFELNTAGGALDSTENIVEALLEDQVPTAVYISPRGALAASAGTFITAAGQFAAMAPGTSVGAASPVGVGGEELPPTLSAKVENAVDALVRSVADVRGRNADELSKTVTEAKTFTAVEAAELNVVDYVANDLSHLLKLLHGQDVVLQTASGNESRRQLQTEGITIRRSDMTLIERFLSFLADPNVSFILISIGGLGIVIELFNPGMFVPVVVGVICLVLAFLSIGALPVNWAGVALILAAMALLTGELLVAGFGVLGIGAIVSFALGALILFSGQELPDAPDIGVNPWLIGGLGATIFVGGWYVMWTIRKANQNQDDTVFPHLIGDEAVVVARLAPRGRVRLHDEVWTAIAEETSVIETGQRVRVVRVDGAVLTVAPVEGA
jgi:membrane-bound serine protease (ClpP class)